jgi:predicted dehydrogenase
LAESIRVGIIGIELGRSWAAVAHVPALQALPNYEIVAVSTRRKSSARAAGKAIGAKLAFDNHIDLVAHPDVDLVAVTVKVPHHAELVSAAIEAGKAVYCEWPLGNGLDEAVKMADSARRAKVPAAVGMQARCAPAVNYVRELVGDGYVGEVLSTTLIGSGLVWGSSIDRPNAYTCDKSNGATMLTIPMGHTVDAVCHCLGQFASLSATTALRRTSTVLVDTGETLPMTAEDQVTFSGVLTTGAVANIHYRGGSFRGVNLLWEINGTDGDIQITGVSGHAQAVDLTLRGGRGADPALQPLPIPKEHRWVPDVLAGPSVNVAQAYARLADDMTDGGHRCPTFDDAVTRHRMIAAVEESASSGHRVTL